MPLSMTTKKQLREEIDKLRNELIRQKISMTAAAPKPWEGKQTRLPNFIHWERRPSEIHKFKTKLPSRLRAKVIMAAPVVEFDPKQLKTAQRHVIRRKLKRFLKNQELTASRCDHVHYGPIYSIVARCRRGYFLYDGNHRCNINLLAGRLHKAHLIDLRDIDNIIKKLKIEDAKKRQKKIS